MQDTQPSTKIERLEAAMSQIKRAFVAAREDLRQGLELTRTQLEIILMFFDEPVWTIGALAERLALTPGAVTQTVETLVRRELIARQPDETDRRIIRLHLGPAGRQLTNHLRRHRLATMHSLADALTDAEVDAFVAATHKFAHVLHQNR
jgi:DNA-binding MarR family transcriptional regulator